jgi:hypothetical protein
LKTKTAPQTGTEVTAVVGDTFFNIIIIPMEPYQPNGWKTGIRSTDLQFGLCGSGRKNKKIKIAANWLENYYFLKLLYL